MHELPARNQLVEFQYQRYFETKSNGVRIWGRCEVTGKNYEITVPTDEFSVYLQGEKNISEALKSVSKEEREFLLSGISPEGWDILFPKHAIHRSL